MKRSKQLKSDQPSDAQILKFPVQPLPVNQSTKAEIEQTGKQYPNISDTKKLTFLCALIKNGGIVSDASRACKLSRDNHYAWMKDDAEYKKAVEDVRQMSIDLSESVLMRHIASGSLVAAMWHLKTIGKKRGYVEKTIHSFDDGDDEVNSTLDL